MTVKRFTLVLYENTNRIKEIRDNGEVIYPPEIVDLLNRLADENEQLKQQLNDCEKFRYFVFKRISELGDSE